jgi:hypothetical protein
VKQIVLLLASLIVLYEAVIAGYGWYLFMSIPK